MKKLVLVLFFCIVNLYANLNITSNSIEINQKDLSNILKNKLPKYKNSKFSLRNYYKYNKYKLLWTNENSEIKDIAFQLLYKVNDDETLKFAKNSVFQLGSILKLYHHLQSSTIKKPSLIVDLDIKLTVLYQNYMSYLSKGTLKWGEFEKELFKLKSEEIYAAWEKYSSRKNYRKLLYKSLKFDDLDISFRAVDITFPKAKKLVKALKFYEDIIKDGDFIKIPNTFNLTLGDRAPIVKILRDRLEQSNLIEKNICQGSYNCEASFDKDIQTALKRFQKNHGLRADGILGYRTRLALNTSAKKRIDTIRLNLERMKWLPRTLGKKYILVNIPDYKLKVYEESTIRFKTKIIVGKKSHPTPIFSNKISYIVLNPYWRIPQRIVKNEILPQIIKNPNYLKDNGINIHETWAETSKQFELENVDLNHVEVAKDLPVKFIQEPSRNNPLGKVKFMFPNKYSVYLHDTPAKSFFRYSKRAYSHGCIRVNEPQKLLETISTIDKDKTKEILSDIQKEKINLNKHIPVHIIYLTSWVNESGEIQFRDDIYGYDKIQKKLLEKSRFL